MEAIELRTGAVLTCEYRHKGVALWREIHSPFLGGSVIDTASLLNEFNGDIILIGVSMFVLQKGSMYYYERSHKPTPGFVLWSNDFEGSIVFEFSEEPGANVIVNATYHRDCASLAFHEPRYSSMDVLKAKTGVVTLNNASFDTLLTAKQRQITLMDQYPRIRKSALRCLRDLDLLLKARLEQNTYTTKKGEIDAPADG